MHAARMVARIASKACHKSLLPAASWRRCLRSTRKILLLLLTIAARALAPVHKHSVRMEQERYSRWQFCPRSVAPGRVSVDQLSLRGAGWHERAGGVASRRQSILARIPICERGPRPSLGGPARIRVHRNKEARSRARVGLSRAANTSRLGASRYRPSRLSPALRVPRQPRNRRSLGRPTAPGAIQGWG